MVEGIPSHSLQLYIHPSRNGVTLIALGTILAALSMLSAGLAAPSQSGQDVVASHLAAITD